ncbi:MAG: hypothetical protein KDB14_10880 [Planctomycetales bacterium]|nr:hypothetical protein [Planctomycetales bacterium]
MAVAQLWDSVITATIIVLVVSSVGCEAEHAIATFPVSGTVSINGEAPVGAIVGLHPSDGDFDEIGSRPAGQVGSDGTFKVSTFGIQDGAPAGNYRVTVFWPQYPGRDDPGEDRLRGRLALPDQSDIMVSITEGDNTLDPIAIDNVSLLPGAGVATN